VVAVAALALLTACSYSTGAEESERYATERPGGEASETTEAAAPTSTLPDPGVAAGTCSIVTYTPPTATEAFDGSLCRPPADTAKDSGVVLVHGGGGVAGNHTGLEAWASSYLQAGHTTLSIDYHLFDPGGESPVFPRPEQNVKAAVQFLRGSAPSLGLDPDRIALHGQSAGARLGAIAYTTPADPRFQGDELWPGVPDAVNAFIGFYSTYDGSHQYDLQYYGGSRDDADPAVREAWAAADAVANADAVPGPAALFTGSLDWAELITQQDLFAERIEAAGHQAPTFVAQGGEHGYDVSPVGLTPDGQIAAAFLVGWLDGVFPDP
jgi:acetyl esterase/lipase